MAFRSVTRFSLAPSALAAGVWIAAQPGLVDAAEPVIQTVTVSGRSAGAVSMAGFGDVPLSRSPFSATVLQGGLLQDAGINGIADLTRLDAGITDAYNAPGYWGQLAVRGFTLDNRFNYRRDGLPVNAETVIAQGNKQAIEILKGTSGLQAGTSAPGGLVNLIVKRPQNHVGTATLSWTQRNSLGVALDVGRRANGFGWRLNADIEHLDPLTRSADGHRRLLALAVEAQLGNGRLLEAEFESNRQSQPSTPGFSLLGDKLPDARTIDPRINLNNQAWALPVVLDGDTASLRWRQKLADGWQFTAHAGTQRLRSDDRIAFPFGCFDPDPAPDGTYYADRYCPNGNFDLYDFRSENERRRTDALDLSLQGKLRTGAIEHALSAGVLQSRVRNRFGSQTFAFSGTGNVDGSVRDLPANPVPNDENTNRDERSTELSLRDAITIDERSTLWLGLRHTRLHRESVRTDGSRPTNYAQSFTTPFVAASYAFAPQQFVYASWSRGIESEVVPNRSRYVNAGQPLPALKSRQAELGLKGSSDLTEWSAALFDIRRPLFNDIGSCDVDDSCIRQANGEQHHRGIEANLATRLDAWTLRFGAQWLRARVQGVSDAAVDGKEPTNVPARTLKLQADYRVAALPGLSLQGGVLAESRRMVLPDNGSQIPGYARADLGARYEQRVGTSNVVWRAGVENLADRRTWRESPYQFGHAYLFPLAARTLRLSVQADL